MSAAQSTQNGFKIWPFGLHSDQVLRMTDVQQTLHDVVLQKEVTVSREDAPNKSSVLLCEKCAVLDYEQMKSPEGQVHHDNWTKLKESADLGCLLCTFFTLAPLHPKSSSRSVFYSDSSGPLHFKFLRTWKSGVTCLHVCVPQDERTAAIYYLYLKKGNSIIL